LADVKAHIRPVQFHFAPPVAVVYDDGNATCDADGELLELPVGVEAPALAFFRPVYVIDALYRERDGAAYLERHESASPVGLRAELVKDAVREHRFH
jgi:hypothetical protein